MDKGRARKDNNLMEEARLALFWYIDDILYGRDWAIEDCYERQGHVNPPASHVGVWEEIKNDITSSSTAYDYFPRGRIVYNTFNDEYLVLADAKIISSTNAVESICQKYNLIRSKTRFQTNVSYHTEGRMIKAMENCFERNRVFQIVNYIGKTPRSIFRQFFLDLKYCKQRIKYGFCDSDLWSIDSWFLAIMPAMISEFIKIEHGFPNQFSNDGGGKKAWDEVLNKMIFLFHEADEEICMQKKADADGDNFAYRNACKDEGIELFKKWFWDLWD